MISADLLNALTSGAGAIVVIAGAGAVLIRAGWAFYRWCRRIEDILIYVDSEMRRNGGSTMRDAIARIDRTVDDIDTRVEALEQAA